ncbi:MAG: molybdopterin-synthase adenylyltransferase MoeB [Leptospirales bacterium]
MNVIDTKLTNEEIKRYSRHLIMPEVGMKGQQKLKGSSVLLIGAGGLGSPLGLYLAAAGIGHIGIVDFDVVDYSNLQRQVMYTTEDIGKSKAGISKERMQKMNPHIKITTYEVPFTAANALEISEDYDIIIDGTDNFPTRYLVNDVCVQTGKINIFGSVFRFDGQATVFAHKDGPCYRCLYPDPPPAGMVPSCSEGGVLGILPGIIGIMQATEAIKIITGEGKPLVGRLINFDALDMKFKELKIKKDPECSVCSPNPTITELIDYEQFCGVSLHGVNVEDGDVELEISVDAVKEILDSGKKPYLLDVRTPEEAEICLLENSNVIPLAKLASHLGEIPMDEDVIVICKVGARSRDAVRLLHGWGYKTVKSMKGGLDKWSEEIDTSMPRY